MDSCEEGVSTLLTLILSAGILIGLGLGILFMGLSYLSSSTKSLEKRGWIFLIIGFASFFTLNTMCDAGL